MTKLPEDFLQNPERFVADLALLESGNAPGWRRWSLNVMDDEKAMEWVKKPSWSLAEAEFLLFGLEARQVDGTWSFFPIASNVGDTTDWFMRDIGAGNLVPAGAVDGVNAFRVADIVASAKRGNIGHWQVWEGYLQGFAEGSPESNAASLLAAIEQKPERTLHLVQRRKNILDAVISSAKRSALDPCDANSVWAALVKMAEADSRPAPLLGFVDEEGIKYQKDNGPAFFTLKNLRDKMRRERGKAN